MITITFDDVLILCLIWILCNLIYSFLQGVLIGYRNKRTPKFIIDNYGIKHLNHDLSQFQPGCFGCVSRYNYEQKHHIESKIK